MRGRTLSGIPLMVVSLVLCLLSSSVISGEHPWGRDNGSGNTSGGTQPGDSSIIRVENPPISCGVSPTGGEPVTQVSEVSWQWRLVMRVSNWLIRYSLETPGQGVQKRVQSKAERN